MGPSSPPQDSQVPMFIAVKRFIHLYPLQTALLCFSLALVNLMEGLGLGLVVPVFQKLLQTSGAPSRLTVMLDRLFASLHLSATLENILLLLCTVFFLRAFATLWARHLSVKISSDFQLNLKNRLYRRLLDAGISFFMVQRQGDLTNVLTVEANRAANAFFSAAQWISTLLAALLYIGVAVFISGWLAFFAGITGIVVLLPLKRIVRRAVFYGNRLTELNENIQNELIEIFGGIKVVKAAAHENQTFQRFSRHNKDYRDAWYRLVFNANSIPIYAQPIAVTLLSVLLYISVQIHIHVAEMMVFLLAFMRLVPSLSLLQDVSTRLEQQFARIRARACAFRASNRHGGAKRWHPGKWIRKTVGVRKCHIWLPYRQAGFETDRSCHPLQEIGCFCWAFRCGQINPYRSDSRFFFTPAGYDLD